MNPIQAVLDKAGIEGVTIKDGRAIIPCNSQQEIELTEKGARTKIPGKEIYTSGKYLASLGDGSLDVKSMAGYISACLREDTTTREVQTRTGSIRLFEGDGQLYTGSANQYFERTA
ncbi:hypothetical protein ACFLZB_02315 [Nanoarchaeota archaeon]